MKDSGANFTRFQHSFQTTVLARYIVLPSRTPQSLPHSLFMKMSLETNARVQIFGHPASDTSHLISHQFTKRVSHLAATPRVKIDAKLMMSELSLLLNYHRYMYITRIHKKRQITTY